LTLHVDPCGGSRRSFADDSPPRVKVEVHDRVNLNVAVNLQVRVNLEVMVEVHDPVAGPFYPRLASGER